MYILPRRLLDARDLSCPSSFPECRSVQFEVGNNRPRVTGSNTSVSNLSRSSVLRHGSKLKLSLQSGSGWKFSVSCNVLQSFSCHLMFCKLDSLELVFDDSTVEVAVFWKLKLHRESERHWLVRVGTWRFS